MLKKWAIGMLTSILTVLVVMRQSTVLANQEIVLEFIDIEMNCPEAINAIARVKNQLRSIGLSDVQISKDAKNGKLKITYPVEAKVAFFKNIHHVAQELAFDLAVSVQHKSPDSAWIISNTQSYTLNIYQIQKSLDFGSDFIVYSVHEIQKESDMPYTWDTSKIGGVFFDITSCSFLDLAKTNQQGMTKDSAVKGLVFCPIPEVRAGPLFA